MTLRQAIDHAFPRGRAFSAIVLVATFGLGTGLGVALVQAHDVRLDEALAALQKAEALVEAARTGTDTTTDPVSPQTQRDFDHHRAKALADIQDAMDHVVAAAAVVDADGSE
jgi:hypothetical protein